MDHFTGVRPNTARGLFVIRLKAVGNNDNDSISIGDVSTFSDSGLPRFGAGVIALQSTPGWTTLKDLYSAEFAAIRLPEPTGPVSRTDSSQARPATLLDFWPAPSG